MSTVAPFDSTYLLVNADTINLPYSQVLTAGPGIELTSTGPGGNYNIAPVQSLLSLTNLNSSGLMTFDPVTKTVATTSLTSDGTVRITNPNGVGGLPKIGVLPFSSNQLIGASANGGSSVGLYPELNFIGLGDASVSVTANPIDNRIDVAIESTSKGSGGVTSVGLTTSTIGLGITGSPITTSGTFTVF